jgi:predicted Fe-S protein YdhL (DUF1289 family)
MIGHPQSPYVAVCALDERAGLCTGCGRTLSEIGKWGGETADWQSAIVALLPERMARHVTAGS